MTENDLELLDFRVIDLTSHIDPGVGAELSLSTKSSISARTPEPFDGTLYMYLKIRIAGQDESLFLLDLTTETIVRLPEGTAGVSDDDAPACVAVAQRETYRAIRELTTAMGITPLDLSAAE